MGCYVVQTPYVPEIIGRKLKNNQPKKERYDSSLIVDRLTITAMALNQGGSTGWFNSATAISVEFKKPTRFILLLMRKLFFSEIHIESIRPTFLMAIPSPTKLLVRWYTLNLQPIINRGKY